MHSLASNSLGETSYVKKSEVSGDSFEVGSVVTYQGRQMTVSKAPDDDGEIKMFDPSGVLQLANALPQTKLQSLKYVAPTKQGRWLVWPTSVSSR